MKRHGLLLLNLFILSAAPVKANPILPSLHPTTSVVLEKKLSVSIPVIPTSGIANIYSFNKLPTLLRCILDIEFPRGSAAKKLLGYLDTLNSLHGKRIYAKGFILPSNIFYLDTKYLEIKVSGGVANYVTALALGPKKEFGLEDLVVDSYGTYLGADSQKVLELKTIFVLGTEIQFIGKIPIEIKEYKLTPLFGFGVIVAYTHKYRSNVNLTEEITATSGLAYSRVSRYSSLWSIYGLLGVQFDGYKWLRPRVMTIWRGQYDYRALIGNFRFGRENFTLDIGLDLAVSDIVTLRAEIEDVIKPTYRIEISKGLLENNEIGLGYCSSLYGNKVGYLLLGLGGRFVKANIITLLSGRTVGLMFGLNLGYIP